MPLTHDEKAGFIRDGLVIRRGFVADDLIARASSLIAHWVREQMDPAQIAAYTRRTFAPELGAHPDLLGLFTESGAQELAVDLLGDIQPVATTQVQIRVPESTLPAAQPEKAMHVDGVACPHLDSDELRTFSLLVGVVLSDVNDPKGGALRYLSGGHLAMADWFRSEWSLGVTEQVPPEIDSEDGTAFLGAPGDILLMHHLVPHSVGRNRTATPRVMAYFRVCHPDHGGRRLEALSNPWLDYPPLAAIRTTTPAVR